MVSASVERRQMKLLLNASIHSVKFFNFTHSALQSQVSPRRGAAPTAGSYLSSSQRKANPAKMTK